jgi:hypothetical protein
MRFTIFTCVQNTKTLLAICFVLFFSFKSFAQTQYISFGSKEYQLLDRLEIKTRVDGLSLSSIKPYPRKQTVWAVEGIDSILQKNPNYANITPVDKENMLHFFMNNSEWSKPRDFYTSRKPVFNAIYKTKGNLLEVNNPDLFLSINPIVNFSGGKEKGYSETLFQNTRGLVARGMISKQVGFNAYFTENQERVPLYVSDWINTHYAIPGAGNFKDGTYSKKAVVDYFDYRGTVSWNVAKFIDMQLGYDKNFIGNGYRSLFLSDFGNANTFFKINTRIWKFDYQNLYFELYKEHGPGGENYFPRKYARMNYLNFKANKWLNVGIFEGVIFQRSKAQGFEFGYLIPVMFIRPAESNIGSYDNSLVGFDAKANLGGHVQVYGQFLLDELKVDNFLSNNGWWANKQGYQAGIKYIDAFGIKNLDLQAEANYVRPFTGQHFDTLSNYTHYNMPLNHPLGANFKEYIAIAKYQPTSRLSLQGTVISYMQGIDSAGINYGYWPGEDYRTRPIDSSTGRTIDYGYHIGDGIKVNCTMVQGVISYELFENMFLEATGFFRMYKREDVEKVDKTTTLSIGLRWNMQRRDFMF